MVDIEQSDIEYFLQKINFILAAMDNDDQLTVLNETDLLLKSIPTKDKKILELKEKLRNILLGPEKMRIIKLLRKIKEDSESGVEYYDSDRGNDSKLHFDKEFEKEMIMLNDDIRTALSTIIKEKIGETKI